MTSPPSTGESIVTLQMELRTVTENFFDILPPQKNPIIFYRYHSLYFHTWPYYREQKEKYLEKILTPKLFSTLGEMNVKKKERKILST